MEKIKNTNDAEFCPFECEMQEVKKKIDDAEYSPFVDLAEYVLWQELKEVSQIESDYLQKSGAHIERIKKGNALYVKKSSIKDPLLRMEANECHNLEFHYPLASFVEELGITKGHKEKIKKSGHVVEIYNIAFFVIPEELYSRALIKKNVVINAIQSKKDSESEYDLVVEITSKYKLGSYTI